MGRYDIALAGEPPSVILNGRNVAMVRRALEAVVVLALACL